MNYEYWITFCASDRRIWLSYPSFCGENVTRLAEKVASSSTARVCQVQVGGAAASSSWHQAHSVHNDIHCHDIKLTTYIMTMIHDIKLTTYILIYTNKRSPVLDLSLLSSNQLVYTKVSLLNATTVIIYGIITIMIISAYCIQCVSVSVYTCQCVSVSVCRISVSVCQCVFFFFFFF